MTVETHTPIAVRTEDLDLILCRLEQFRHGLAFDRETAEAIGRVRGAFPEDYPALAPIPFETWEYRIRSIVVTNGFEQAVRNGDIVEAAQLAITALRHADMLIAPESAPKA